MIQPKPKLIVKKEATPISDFFKSVGSKIGHGLQKVDSLMKASGTTLPVGGTHYPTPIIPKEKIKK